jgi:hypothetical protein
LGVKPHRNRMTALGLGINRFHDRGLAGLDQAS